MNLPKATFFLFIHMKGRSVLSTKIKGKITVCQKKTVDKDDEITDTQSLLYYFLVNRYMQKLL